MRQFGLGQWLDSTASAVGMLSDEAFVNAAMAEMIDTYTLAGAQEARIERMRTDRTVRHNLTRDVAYEIAKAAEQKSSPAPDRYRTAQAMEKQIDQAGLRQEFSAYVTATLDGVTKGERIPQGFSPSGNRRYVPHTLENVVKILKKELRGGESFNYGVGSLRAKFTPEFKSLDAIRKAKGRLVSAAEFEAMKADIDQQFEAVRAAMGEKVSDDIAMAILEDAPKMGLDRSARESGITLTDEARAKTVAFLNLLRELPTAYFEAKVMREVDPAEFGGAVVPDDVSPEALQYLKDRGIKDIRTYSRGDGAARAAQISQFTDLFFQQARGQIALGADITSTPSIITLLQGADLSTFTHEAGHFYLEVLTDLAAKIEAQQRQGASIEPGEAEILADARKLLAWFGIKDAPELSALTQWFAMSTEEKRPHHESFARGFEAYAFEGRAPSVELQGPFQKFRAWMLNAYKQLKALNVTLTDEVRGVMDRMLATSEQIQTAEAARNMGALFQTAEQAGMTPEQWANTHYSKFGQTEQRTFGAPAPAAAPVVAAPPPVVTPAPPAAAAGPAPVTMGQIQQLLESNAAKNSAAAPAAAQAAYAPAAAVTREIDPTKTTAGLIDSMLKQSSPYIQNAQEMARDEANSRGLLSSSMAAGAGTAAAIAAAAPIAQADAALYASQGQANMGAQNQANLTNAGNSLTASTFNAGSQNAVQNMGYQSQLNQSSQVLQGNIASALQTQGASEDLTKMAVGQTYDLAKMNYGAAIDIGKMKYGAELDLSKMAVGQGYTLQQLQQVQTNDLAKMGIGNGYDIQKMNIGAGLDLNKLAAANGYDIQKMGVANDYEIQRLVRASELDTASKTSLMALSYRYDGLTRSSQFAAGLVGQKLTDVNRVIADPNISNESPGKDQAGNPLPSPKQQLINQMIDSLQTGMAGLDTIYGTKLGPSFPTPAADANKATAAAAPPPIPPTLDAEITRLVNERLTQAEQGKAVNTSG